MAAVAVANQGILQQLGELATLTTIHAIDRIETLVSQRPAKAAKVLTARLDLERCRVVAPFDAYVTNMNISEGAYAHPGSPMFTLIDTRNWWIDV
jgi:membrane fusion protein, multidrug efflux system